MSELKKGYKIVCEYSGKLKSLFINNDKLYVEYKIGEFVHSRDERFPLTIFDNLDNVVDFLTRGVTFSKKIKIFKCFYEESNKPIIYFNKSLYSINNESVVDSVVDLNNLYDFLSVWRPMVYSRFPRGTVFADKVKLIEEVDNGWIKKGI